MAEAVLTRRSVVKNGFQLLADIIVSGSSVTQVDIGGLNIGKGDEVVLVMDLVNGTGSGSDYYLYTNGNTTLTNYYMQRVEANSTTITGSRLNGSYLIYNGAGLRSLLNLNLKLTNNGYFVAQEKANRYYGGSSLILEDRVISSTFTLTSITQLSIVSGFTSAIGIGSRFQLYKLGGI